MLDVNDFVVIAVSDSRHWNSLAQLAAQRTTKIDATDMGFVKT